MTETSKSGDSQPLKASLGFLIAAFLLAEAATAAEPIELEILSKSRAALADAETSTFDQLWTVARTASEGRQTTEPLLRAHGHLAVERITASTTYIRNPVFPEREIVQPYSPATIDRLSFQDVDLELEIGMVQGAVILGVERADVMSVETLRVHGSVENPTIRGLGGTESDGSRFHRGEQGHWQLSGSFISLDASTLNATGRGSLQIYWFNSEVVLSNATHRETLPAFTQEENLAAGYLARRTYVSYEGVLSNATFSVSTSRLTQVQQPLLFAERLRATGVAQIGFDSPDRVSGSSSPLARKGSSFWVEGNLDAQVAPTGVGRTYTIAVTGMANQASVGGSKSVSLGGGAVAAPVSVLLALLLFSYRDALAATIGRLAFPLYTKLKKDHLLDVPARDSIFRQIQATPGIHFLQLHKTVRTNDGSSVAFGALAYHLAQMERFQLIVSKREGRYRRYFDTGTNLGADTGRVALLQTAPVPTIARLLLANPGTTQGVLHQRLAAELPITRQALSYHLKRLIAKDLAQLVTEGRFHRYRPTERLLKLAAFVAGPAPATQPAEAAPAA